MLLAKEENKQSCYDAKTSENKMQKLVAQNNLENIPKNNES